MSASLRLSFGSNANERTRPLIDGSVSVEGIELIPTVSHPSETFWRQLRFLDFDISEMSLSSFFIAKSRGIDLVAIPAFPSRRFFHIELDCHADAGITHPSDLAGKRIGVAEYQQTAALWLRAVLEHDFGVSQHDVHWYMERAENLSHGGATGFTPPEGISFHRVPPEKSLASMLLRNEIDAAFVRPIRRVAKSNPIDRSQRHSGDAWEKIVPAFGDGFTEGKRFYGAHGFIPINHTYVIRGELLRQHPWIALNLFKAFIEAKEIGERSLFENIPLSLVFRWEFLDIVREGLGADLFPYGINANRSVLESMIGYSHEQGLIPEPLILDELFAPSTLDWT